MGHEASGVIEKVGAKVAGWKPGDRVTFDSTVFCGGCKFCQRGQINLCDNRRVMGVSCEDYRQHGAYAEFVVTPVLWPDFRKTQFVDALEEYARRHRRFGGV